MNTILDRLNKIAVKLREEDSLEGLQKAIITEGTILSGAKYGSLYLYQKRRLDRVYSTLPKKHQVNIRTKGHTYKCFSSRKIITIPVYEVVKAHKSLDRLRVKSLILVPLVYQNKSIGVLSFDSLHEAFTEEQIKVLRLFATMATYSLNQIFHTQQMQTAIEIRDVFISVTAHEFRTPLTTINGYIQLMKRKMKKQKQYEYMHSWVQEMNDEVHRLIDLTNELLQISKIKTGKVEYSFEILTLATVIATATKRFNFLFPEHGIKVNYQLKNDMVVADHDKLLQAITNILENAGKYTGKNKTVVLTVSKHQSWNVIKIRDYGRGIAQNDLERIFNGFFKAKNSKENSGMGLGLFIAKSIIESHNGKLLVDSELGKGTEFSIWLPELKHGTTS